MGGLMSIKGNAFSNIAISQLMDSLESQAHIDSVYLRVIRREEIDGTPILSFEIGCQVGRSEEGASS
jgi:hypothetical protein